MYQPTGTAARARMAGGEGDGRGDADCGRGAQAALWPAEDRRGSAAALQLLGVGS